MSYSATANLQPATANLQPPIPNLEFSVHHGTQWQ